MDYWNHNTAYYGWIKKETAYSRSVLDIGCGDGSLIACLDDGSKKLIGIDSDKFCIFKADSRCKTQNTEFICRSFEDFETDDKFDAVTFVASLHHMEMKRAIGKSVSLLNDGGVLLIVGLAKPSNAVDYIIEALRVMPCAVISRIKRMRSSESEKIPVSYDFPEMDEIRKAADEMLPGYSLKYGLFYRFLLKWTKR